MPAILSRAKTHWPNYPAVEIRTFLSIWVTVCPWLQLRQERLTKPVVAAPKAFGVNLYACVLRTHKGCGYHAGRVLLVALTSRRKHFVIDTPASDTVCKSIHGGKSERFIGSVMWKFGLLCILWLTIRRTALYIAGSLEALARWWRSRHENGSEASSMSDQERFNALKLFLSQQNSSDTSLPQFGSLQEWQHFLHGVGGWFGTKNQLVRKCD